MTRIKTSREIFPGRTAMSLPESPAALSQFRIYGRALQRISPGLTGTLLYASGFMFC